MDILLLGARLALAAIFLVSGLAKILDQRGTQDAVRNFGTPVKAVPAIALILPIIEIGVVIALIPLTTAWYGAIGAFVLLALFSTAIAVNLARGNTPDCHCFGQLHSEPIGWRTLARNGALAIVAGVIILTGFGGAGLSATAWAGRASLFEVLVLGIAVVALLAAGVLGWLAWQLLQQNGRILTRLDELERTVGGGSDVAPSIPGTRQHTAIGLPVGTAAPPFELPGLQAEMLTRDSLLSTGKPLVLLFSDPGCGPCNALLPAVRQWQRDHAGAITIAVVTRGSLEANRTKAREHEVAYMLLQKDREVANAYQVRGTPSALVLRPDGTIGSPLAQGAEAIRELVALTVRQHSGASSGTVPGLHHSSTNGNEQRESAAAPARPPVLRIGQPAPAIELPNLDGETISLGSLAGSDTLVLFWNPVCGFCQRMLNQVRAWDAVSDLGKPRLFIVSTGSIAANREMGLKSPIVLDDDGAVRRRFGVRGTPSGVLIDTGGRIASELAVGSPSILGLARSEPAGHRPGRPDVSP